MAIEYVGGKVFPFIGTTSPQSIPLTGLTGGLASAPAAGDVVVVAYSAASDNNPASLAIFTEGYNTGSLGQLNITSDNYDTHLLIGVKAMPAPPDTLVEVSGTSNTRNAGSVIIQVYRGVNTSVIEDVARVSTSGVDSWKPNPPAITPATAGAKIIVVGAGSASTTGNLAASYLTNFLQTRESDSADTTIGMGNVDWSGSGSYDPAVFTSASADNIAASWLGCTLALKPAVVAPIGGKVKVRIGASWTEKPVKVRIGGAWVEKPLKVYKSGAWVLA